MKRVRFEEGANEKVFASQLKDPDMVGDVEKALSTELWLIDSLKVIEMIVVIGTFVPVGDLLSTVPVFASMSFLHP